MNVRRFHRLASPSVSFVGKASLVDLPYVKYSAFVSRAISPPPPRDFPFGVGLTIDTTPLTPIILTASQTPWAEAQAKRERELGERLSQLAVTPAEAAILYTVQYGIFVTPCDLPRIAVGEGEDIGTFTEEQCRAALTICFDKDWLQIIDESALAKIADYIRANHLLGPIYGLPQLGTVDFTSTGAALWQQIVSHNSNDRPPFAYTDVVHEKSSRYFRTKANAIAEIDLVRADDDFATVSEPIPIGPWRAQWWRRFPTGYRVEIEERRKWQGCSSRCDEDCHLFWSPERHDQLLLREVLAHYEITVVEWRILQAMERGPRLFGERDFSSFVGFVDQESDGIITDTECRSGLENCLQSGWLRVLDDNAISNTRELLASDSAVLAVPKTARLEPDVLCNHFVTDRSDGVSELELHPTQGRAGEIDFTPVGAALYRMICREWLGRDCENDLYVSNCYYREEHRYCEKEIGLRWIAEGYMAEGFDVHVRQVVPIGPWCVYWWKRYPAGYRMELEISQRK